MGWYEVVGRRAFFALDPETAHRLAIRMLGLPLPWSRIGGVARDIAPATMAGITLRNPIGLAAGFDKGCERLDALGRLGFGYVVGGTVTRAPREGNARPRIARDADRQALVNAMGLPNPGAEVVAGRLERGRRTCPRFVSLADESVEDAVHALHLIEPHVDGIELNASCPNVSWGRDRDNEAHLAALVSALVSHTSKPVLVKLPPFEEGTEKEVVLALARVAHEAGARGLTCGNTRPVEDGRMAVGRGGLSGKPLWPRTAASVEEVCRATGGELDVNACGGVFTAEDVAECLAAGAATVQVYTGLIYEGPGLPGKLTRGMLAI
jgi:dihydroorotate dehydrogenase